MIVDTVPLHRLHQKVLPCGHPEINICPFCLDITLEAAIDWALNLATSVNPASLNNRNRRRARQAPRNNRDRPSTPHPAAPQVFLSPRAREPTTSVSSDPPAIYSTPPVIPSGEPVPQINQANSTGFVFPRIGQFAQPAPVPRPRIQIPQYTAQGPVFGPVVEQSSSSEEILHRLPSRARELHSYYPETIYVSSTLPTRSSQEITEFLTHSRILFQDRAARDVVINHPLEKAYEITTSPLNFQNLLWKAKVTISTSGIYEEYSWIRRRPNATRPDRAILVPAYSVQYQWNTESWTVTCVPNRHLRA